VNEIADTFLRDGGLMNTTVEAQGQQVDVSLPMNMVLWTMFIGVAGMFFMAGGSKLSGSEPMVQLFQAIGLGQWFRYFTGFMEVGGAVLVLLPGLSGLGAALLTGVMAGAVGTHLFLIGGNPTLPIVLLVR
jgi:putative oxidoreductase